MDAILKVKDNSELLLSAERRVAELLKSKAALETTSARLAEAEKTIAQTPLFEQMAATAEAKAREIESTTRHIRHFAAMQAVRVGFARVVAASGRKLATGLVGLHHALTGQDDGNLRRIVLAVIFLQRWTRLSSMPKLNFDPSSLAAFAASSGNTSGEEKLARIEQVFATLTDELRATKENLADQRLKTKQVQDKYKDIDGEAVALQVESAKKQTDFYKRRVTELVAANAEMVHPDNFQEVLTRATEAELAVDHLTAAVKLKDDEITRQIAVIKEATRDLQRAELRHEADVKEAQRLKLVMEDHQTEIEVLNSKLQDRTKDLLALERMNAYKPPGAFPPEPLRRPIEEADPIFASPRLNPRFLGSGQNPVE
jgi:hypothetical protein